MASQVKTRISVKPKYSLKGAQIQRQILHSSLGKMENVFFYLISRKDKFYSLLFSPFLCVPDPHSRVILKSKSCNDLLSSYINANYIRVSNTEICLLPVDNKSNKISQFRLSDCKDGLNSSNPKHQASWWLVGVQLLSPAPPFLALVF